MMDHFMEEMMDDCRPARGGRAVAVVGLASLAVYALVRLQGRARRGRDGSQ